MFKHYLRTQPAGVQLVIFLTLWTLCSLLFVVLQPVIIRSFEVDASDLSSFLDGGLYDHPNLVMALNAAGSLLLFFIPAFLFAYLASPEPMAYLGFKWPAKRQQWVWTVFLCLGVILVITTIGGYIKKIDLGESAKVLNEKREEVFSVYLKATDFWGLVKNIFFLALIPAVGEELFFRGVVQRFAHTWIKKPLGSILVSGILFALFHYSVYEFVPILIAGLVLAWVYHITSSMYLSILLHFLNNGLQIVIAFYMVRNPQFDNLEANEVWQAVMLVAGLLALTFFSLKLYKNKTPLPLGWSVAKRVDL